MPNQLNWDLERHYTWVAADMEHKMKRRQCRYCKVIRADNVSRLRDHIDNDLCSAWKQQRQRDELLMPQKTLPKLTTIPKPDPTTSPIRPFFVTKERQRQLDKLAALTIYEDARPFTLYESSAMHTFLSKLEPGYKPPHGRALANNLLDEAYTDTQERVELHLRASTKWNIVFDESEDIQHHRIINLIICVNKGPFFYGQFVLGSATVTAEFLRDWLIEQLREATHGELGRINSIATDTCSTMFKVYDLIRASDELRHVIYAPCDAHGLQLLLKDILELQELEPFMKTASKIVGFFNRATKQYAHLRDQQVKEYRTHKALILSAITRWGTQLDMVKSLLRSKQALRNYAAQQYTGDNKDRWIISTIQNDELWERLGLISELLAPIHEAQKISESTRAHLGLTRTRWLHIRAEFARIKQQQDKFHFIDWSLLWELFDTREARQLRPIYYLAQYLMPCNWDLNFYNCQTTILEGLRSLLPDEHEYQQAVTSFYCFRTRRAPFDAGAHCWDQVNLTWPFWYAVAQGAPILAAVGERVLTTTANSVPSERAFSTMKLQHTKLRNRLAPERVNKLVFIHVNRRILDNDLKALDDSEEDKLQLERDVGVLIDEEYLQAEIDNEAEKQQHHAGELFAQDEENTRASSSSSSKRPASVVLAGPGRQLHRYSTLEDHFGGTHAPKE